MQGILGLGLRSTQFYIEELNRRYHQEHGDYHTFPCLINYVDFDELNPFLPNNFETLFPVLTELLDDFFNMPIHSCLIPNITLHETYDLAHLDYNVIHPLKAATNFLKTQRITSVILFGSLYTMTSDYIPSTLETNAISVHRPSTSDMKILDDFRKKIYDGTETVEDFEAYKTMVQFYSKSNPILISCTELSIYSPKLNNEQIIDMALLQIDAVLDGVH